MYARFHTRHTHAAAEAGERRGLVVGLVVTRYVYEFISRNNPAGPSRDKSFLEFYLVIEFPGVAGVNVNARALHGTTGCEEPVAVATNARAEIDRASLFIRVIRRPRIILIFFIVFMTGSL